MKKIISVLVALILVVSGFAFTVSAAPSPEVKDVITIVDILDEEGEKAAVELIEIAFEKLEEILKPADKNESVIGQYTVKVIGAIKNKVKVIPEIMGVKSTSTVYILAKKADGTVIKIPAVVTAEGKVEFELEEGIEMLSVVVDKETATNIGVSDKTGDNSYALVMAILGLAMATAVVSVKKIKA
ncbi:MAG: hypothetical protein J6D52_11050 [Clostridia bacterium]|nr:hypothetical protein [Clostridia bacterium]